MSQMVKIIWKAIAMLIGSEVPLYALSREIRDARCNRVYLAWVGELLMCNSPNVPTERNHQFCNWWFYPGDVPLGRCKVKPQLLCDHCVDILIR